MPRKSMLSIALLLLLAFLSNACAGPAAAPMAAIPGQSVIVTGLVNAPRIWTPANLEEKFAAEIKTIRYTSKEVAHTARALPLLSLINAAVPKLDPKIKNGQLRLVVVVEAKDGYVATFALAELLPENGNREAWVALTVDDKPLTARDAPLTLIVTADQKPERFVHGIQSIRVVDASVLRKP